MRWHLQMKNKWWFSLCCHKGKVILPKFKGPAEELKKLFLDKNCSHAKNFRKNIRKYNNACAFASMVSNIDPLNEKPGPCLLTTVHKVSNNNHSRHHHQLKIQCSGVKVNFYFGKKLLKKLIIFLEFLK